MLACSDDAPTTQHSDATTDSGGDGDGDPATGDGDGDGDPATGDGDGDAVCGDGIVDEGEACDDGNAIDTDACTSACVEAFCGDGIVHEGVEDCDDANADNTDDCIDTCAAASCGDGYVGPGEGCDDGNAISDDACSNTCVPATCGDGVIQEGEDCDDANADNTDACLDTCAAASCGDSYIQAGVEECDDANLDDTDSCPSSCVPASCGDGYIQANVEECDDANMDNTDDCLDTCVSASCGDGYIQAGVEDCEDFNMDEADGCLSTCVTPESCLEIRTELMAPPSGIYLIDPDGPGQGVTEFDAYCDMVSDGGGWTLLSWTGDSGSATRGVPYPGLAICPTLDCLRGSAADSTRFEALFDVSTELAKGYDAVLLPTYADLADYTASGRYDYDGLAGLALTFDDDACDGVAPFAVGTFTSITGSNGSDGVAVYLVSGFRAYDFWDYSSDANNYIWSIGTPNSYCYAATQQPTTAMGTWNSCQYGPNNPGCDVGAHVVYVR